MDEAATGHRPRVPRIAPRGGVELLYPLLESELGGGWNVTEVLEGAAQLEVWCDAEQPFGTENRSGLYVAEEGVRACKLVFGVDGDEE